MKKKLLVPAFLSKSVNSALIAPFFWGKWPRIKNSAHWLQVSVQHGFEPMLNIRPEFKMQCLYYYLTKKNKKK